MLISPLGHRNIIAASPFAKEREQGRKARLERLKAIPVQPDPVPENRLSYKKAAVALATTTVGGIGLWYSGKALYNLLPSRRESASASLPASTPHSASQPGWAKLLQAIPGTQAIPWLYALHQSNQGINSGIGTAYNAVQEKKRGRLDLGAVYQSLHQEGIQGEGFKVAVLDAFPKQEKNKKIKSDFIKAQVLSEKPHGSAVSRLIQKAAPKAEVIPFQVVGEQTYSEVWDKMRDLIAASREEPEKLTKQAVRDCLTPLIKQLSDSLRSAVDQGAMAVNVSIGPENVIQWLVNQAQAESEKRFRKQGMMMTLLGTPDFEAFEAEKQYYQRLAKLFSLFNPLNDRNQPIQPELLSLYQPWYDAVSYAASKNALVVVSAGNKGKVFLHAAPNGLNHINPLGLKRQGNTNVMWAASTDEAGVLSGFSSEYNNQIMPDIAANGSGQLNTQGSVLLPSANWLKVNPFMAFPLAEVYRNPSGTSFAAPDLVGLYVMMQSARKKDGQPPLSVDEFQQVLRLAAQPVKTSEPQQVSAEIAAEGMTWNEEEDLKQRTKALNEEPVTPHNTDKLLRENRELEQQQEELGRFRKQLQTQLEQEAVKRRVGPYGTVAGRRLHAIALGRAYEPETQRRQHTQDPTEVD